MEYYLKAEYKEEFLRDWFASLWNKLLFKMAVSTAKRRHEVDNKVYHVVEMSRHYIVINNLERKDINKSGKVNKMKITDLLEHSIWNTGMCK